MRVAIRDQLGVLVLLCTLIALAVVASASWAINFQIVSNVRTSRMSLTAALMSSQLASILTLIQVSTKALTTRVRVQEAILAYNTGSTSSDLFLLPAQDLEAALDNTGRNSLAVQCSVTAHTGTSARKSLSLLNTTGAGVNVELPSTYPNGTHVRLGDPGVGFPASLYPEIFIERDVTRTRDQILYTNSTILLGPLQINASYSLLSLTIPMLQNTNNSNILAWMTVVVDSSLVVQYLTSRQGLGETGTILIVGPDYPNNRFPGNLTDASFPVAGDENYFESAPVHFVWPVDESNYTAKRHNDSQQASFSLSQYPALINSFVSEQTGVSTVHTDLSTVNEIGKRVAIGYNLVPSTLATWVLVAELSHEEIWSPIYSLRNVLLGCIFGTAVGMLVFIWPLAHFASTPIRRLGEATRHSIQPQDTKVALATPCARLHDSALPSDPDAMPADSTGDVAGLPHEKRPFLVRLNLMNGPGKTHAHLSPSAQRWRDMEPGTRNFQVPAKVKESKHYIHDELTDLTETFNRMADELLKQYTILEERVRDRTRELEVSKHAAEAANESKTLFIANISHELKTPLNGILGMCAVCMQETDPEKIRRSLGIIYRSGDLLHNLLTDLLTFSKNEAGQRLALEEKCFKLRDISAQLKAIFDAQAEENKVEFTIGSRGSYDRWGNRVEDGNGEYGPAGIGLIRNLHLWGDYHRILQVVINLVSNSLKFTPSQGRVKVLIRCMPLESKSPQTDAGSARSSRNSDVATCKRLPPALSLPHKKRPSDAARNRAASSTRPQVQPCDESWKTRSSTDEPEGPTGPGSDATTVWFDFEVSDTGPGVPHHLQEKIFEPFVQGDLRLTKKYGGTGLGLSICSQLAKLMRGTITLQSEPGLGSKFILRIPLRAISGQAAARERSTSSLSVASTERQPDSDVRGTASVPDTLSNLASTSERRRSSHFDTESRPHLLGLSQPFFSTVEPATDKGRRSSPVGRLHVLIAEDNAINQEVVLRMLRLEGVFNVEVAKDGQEAYDLVKHNMASGDAPYDLIFMDVQMPNVDGRESTRLIRHAGYKAPIVALTAFADDANEKECIDSGMDGFLAKPIRRPALKQVLKTYCASTQGLPEAGTPTLQRNTYDVDGQADYFQNPFDTDMRTLQSTAPTPNVSPRAAPDL